MASNGAIQRPSATTRSASMVDPGEPISSTIGTNWNDFKFAEFKLPNSKEKSISDIAGDHDLCGISVPVIVTCAGSLPVVLVHAVLWVREDFSVEEKSTGGVGVGASGELLPLVQDSSAGGEPYIDLYYVGNDTPLCIEKDGVCAVNEIETEQSIRDYGEYDKGDEEDDSNYHVESEEGDLSKDAYTSENDVSEMWVDYEGSENDILHGNSTDLGGRKIGQHEADMGAKFESFGDNLHMEDIGEFNKRAIRDDDLHSIMDSDSERDNEVCDFNEEVRLKDSELCKGMKFTNGHVFRKALRE
ncbi:hypothetical protein GH714_006610 [Hevea brasiliensis]|uniref:Uncharacterized protein n=1 Tax=Hevea brasiliensis TaxID=3981 RepID=A0A6A6NBV0_HEVBR|nr:hypothetical protein GH714_006610 [Hevea brasiliensis]